MRSSYTEKLDHKRGQRYLRSVLKKLDIITILSTEKPMKIFRVEYKLTSTEIKPKRYKFSEDMKVDISAKDAEHAFAKVKARELARIPPMFKDDDGVKHTYKNIGVTLYSVELLASSAY